MDFEGSGEVEEEEEEGGFADIQRLMRVFSILKILRVIKIARHSTGIQASFSIAGSSIKIIMEIKSSSAVNRIHTEAQLQGAWIVDAFSCHGGEFQHHHRICHHIFKVIAISVINHKITIKNSYSKLIIMILLNHQVLIVISMKIAGAHLLLSLLFLREGYGGHWVHIDSCFLLVCFSSSSC